MALPERPKRVDLSTPPPFTFMVGVDLSRFDILRQRIDDALVRLERLPRTPRVSAVLEREVHACGVLYTSRIEGGVLTEAEINAALDRPNGSDRSESVRRVINIGSACRFVSEAAAAPGWSLTTGFIRKVHEILSEGVPHDRNRPGELRDGSGPEPRPVGDESHGGLYMPPIATADVERLFDALVSWHGEIAGSGVPAAVRAPLVHLYFELIHPFVAGNGLVGRLLEAAILIASGQRLVPFPIWRFYAERSDRFFSLFNECRKAAAAGEADPNSAFVGFHLEATLSAVERLHDRGNSIVAGLLFEGEVRRLKDDGEINLRQFAVLSHLMESGEAVALDRLRRAPWYEGLYRGMADKTKQRDLKQLRENELVKMDDMGMLSLGFSRPPV
jgi:hypothetical protein